VAALAVARVEVDVVGDGLPRDHEARRRLGRQRDGAGRQARRDVGRRPTAFPYTLEAYE
jgi:hypothetical protein